MQKKMVRRIRNSGLVCPLHWRHQSTAKGITLEYTKFSKLLFHFQWFGGITLKWNFQDIRTC